MSLRDTGEGHLHNGFINLWNLPYCLVCWQSHINQSWFFRGARLSTHQRDCLSCVSGWSSVLPPFQLLLPATWHLCFIGDLNPPWSCGQNCRETPASVQGPSQCQGISLELGCTHAQSKVPNLDYTLHSPRAGTLSLGNSVSHPNICRIRTLKVQRRLGTGSVWYCLEGCAQLKLHLPLWAMRSPKGNACLEMSSCCCTVFCACQHFLDSHVCRYMNYPLAEGWFHPLLFTRA